MGSTDLFQGKVASCCASGTASWGHWCCGPFHSPVPKFHLFQLYSHCAGKWWDLFCTVLAGYLSFGILKVNHTGQSSSFSLFFHMLKQLNAKHNKPLAYHAQSQEMLKRERLGGELALIDTGSKRGDTAEYWIQSDWFGVWTYSAWPIDFVEWSVGKSRISKKSLFM